MSIHSPLSPDGEAIGQFVSAMFRDAEIGTYVSLRAFRDDASHVFGISAHQVTDDLSRLAVAAEQEAMRAAKAPFPVVFAPPVATFGNPDKADEASLANGLALSVECDATPGAARARLEGLLGPATVVVASGGEWIDPASGEVEPKLHLHWRLTEPTREHVPRPAEAGAPDCAAACGRRRQQHADGPSHPMAWKLAPEDHRSPSPYLGPQRSARNRPP